MLQNAQLRRTFGRQQRKQAGFVELNESAGGALGRQATEASILAALADASASTTKANTGANTSAARTPASSASAAHRSLGALHQSLLDESKFEIKSGVGVGSTAEAVSSIVPRCNAGAREPELLYPLDARTSLSEILHSRSTNDE